MAVTKEGVATLMPQADGEQINTQPQSIVLETFTRVVGNKQITYGLLYRTDTKEIITAIAEGQHEKDGQMMTNWQIIMSDRELKVACDRFYAAKVGIVKLQATGIVTVTV